jgi:hypothetical protein
MRAVNLQNDSKQAADQTIYWQSIVQRGNRIIDNDIIFATSFSDLFQLEINYKILSIDRIFNLPF